MTRPINDMGLNLIKSFEDCVLIVYNDSREIPTVGWGHKVMPADGLKLGDIITQERADELLKSDLDSAQKTVSEYISSPLNDNQYAACVSFAYNAGVAPFIGKFGKLLNEGFYADAANDFTHWDHIRLDGELVVSGGLLRRRDSERELFLQKINNNGSGGNG